MNFVQALLAVIVPLVPMILPGAFFISIRDYTSILISGARIILWSMGTVTLVVTGGLVFGFPVQVTVLVLGMLSVANVIMHKHQFFSRISLWHTMTAIVPMVILLAMFTIPFLIIHDGLPTGDVQKTIIWAQEIYSTHRLPDYTRAISLLNRDPVDFYTPGLHAVSALVLGISPVPLTSIGIFAIAIALCVAWIAAALMQEMQRGTVYSILAVLFTLTQYRFLRYLREPGYHIQNLVGELFVFGILLVYIRFVQKREMQDALLLLLLLCALFITHQFSMFIAIFMLMAVMVTTVIQHKSRIMSAMKTYVRISLTTIILLTIALAIASSLELGNKLPALFTSTPHLTGLLPSLTDYPMAMGEVWFFAGAAGVILLIRRSVPFASVSAIILLLSQGPAIGIDIPPVRALFYLVVPFSIGAAYFFGKLIKKHRRWRVALIIVIIALCSSSTYKAYASLSHTVRTNSTLTGEQLGIIEQLGDGDGILIDDYNRRSSSWLVLSGRPMFTRIAADLERQMEEAKQSPLRMELYLRQLDYEKIFSLGSMPEMTTLFAKNKIAAVTGIAASSQTSFMHNPSLIPIITGDDITIYKANTSDAECASSDCTFLLRPSTLANDIGDNEDVFQHLQASIRSARLSEPVVFGTTTYRQTTASHIPITFNVGDFVRILWDPNNIHRPETSLTFMVFFTRSYESLSLQTPSGKIIPLPSIKHATVALQPETVPIDERGFITLTLLNPLHQTVSIDIVALGPSSIP